MYHSDITYYIQWFSASSLTVSCLDQQRCKNMYKSISLICSLKFYSSHTDVLHVVNCLRRNWKDRFFVLKQDKTLCYYDTSDYHSAKPQKTIELSQVINLIDGGSKEHAFGIETADRTYHITAASSEEKR